MGWKTERHKVDLTLAKRAKYVNHKGKFQVGDHVRIIKTCVERLSSQLEIRIIQIHVIMPTQYVTKMLLDKQRAIIKDDSYSLELRKLVM